MKEDDQAAAWLLFTKLRQADVSAAIEWSGLAGAEKLLSNERSGPSDRFRAWFWRRCVRAAEHRRVRLRMRYIRQRVRDGEFNPATDLRPWEQE